MNSKLRQKAILLRTKERLSYGEIRKRLGIPKSTLGYWLQEHPLTEEEIVGWRRIAWARGEKSRERFRNTMRAKRVELDKRVYEKYRAKIACLEATGFFVAGLMLYLGEGDKKTKGRVGIANSDPEVIQFFLKWINDFLGISHQRMHAELHLYENMNIPKEKLFWQKITGFAKGQFYKTQIRKVQKGKFAYKGPQRHGTCSVLFDSVEKKEK